MTSWRQNLSLFLTLIVCVGARVSAAELTVDKSFESYRDSGEKAFAQNNYGVAERSFLAALKVAETQGFPAKDPRWAQAYKNLAGLYELRSQFAKSEFYLERELRAREKSLGSENPQVLALVGKLCRSYLTHNNQAKGDRLSNLLLSYADRILKEEQQLDAHFADLQKFFSAHSEYAEPEKKLKLVKEAAQKVRGDDHLELAASLDAIATIYKERTKYAQAETLLRRSIDLREKTLVPGHQALAFGYENLGNLYVLQGKTQQAKPLFEQAMEITRGSLDPKRPEMFSRLDKLASSYISLGQLGQAESLYKQALTVIKENGGAGSKDCASASSALAGLYMKQGRYSEAAPLMKTALSINEGIYGPQSASIAPLLDSYAEALEKSSKGSEAAKIRQRANTIRGNASACKDTSAISSADF